MDFEKMMQVGKVERGEVIELDLDKLCDGKSFEDQIDVCMEQLVHIDGVAERSKQVVTKVGRRIVIVARGVLEAARANAFKANEHTTEKEIKEANEQAFLIAIARFNAIFEAKVQRLAARGTSKQRMKTFKRDMNVILKALRAHCPLDEAIDGGDKDGEPRFQTIYAVNKWCNDFEEECERIEGEKALKAAEAAGVLTLVEGGNSDDHPVEGDDTNAPHADILARLNDLPEGHRDSLFGLIDEIALMSTAGDAGRARAEELLENFSGKVHNVLRTNFKSVLAEANAA